MKKLSDFEGAEGVSKAAEVLEVFMRILKNEKNQKLRSEENITKMFTSFMANTPSEMLEIFAILSNEDVKDYKCNGAEAMQNILILINDPIIMGLFLSQSQTGDAKSSGSASQNKDN